MKKSLFQTFTWTAGAIAISGALMATGALAADSAKTVHLRGKITQTSDDGFTMQTDAGESRKVALGSDARLAGVTESSLDQVEQGTFIGTANVENDQGNKALEVVVFPDSMKGTGLGDYPWDLSPSDVKSKGSSDTKSSDMKMSSGSSMTNGTVKQTQSGGSGADEMSSSMSMSSGGSSMTNGTVTQADSGDTMSVKVDYGDGSKTINIPKDVPVVKVGKASMSDIKKGAHVFVAGAKGSNPFQAGMVIVGIDGTVPPM